MKHTVFVDLESEGGGSADEPELSEDWDTDDREAIDDRPDSELSVQSSSDEEISDATAGVTAGRQWELLGTDSDDSDFDELMGQAKALSPQFNNRAQRAAEELPHMVDRRLSLTRQNDIVPVPITLRDDCYFADVGELPISANTGKVMRGCKFFATLNGSEEVIAQAADYAKRFAAEWETATEGAEACGQIEATEFRGWTYMLVVQETGEVNKREHLHALFISHNNNKRSYKNVQDIFFNGAKADVKVCRNDTNACIYLRKGDQPKAEYQSTFADGPTYGHNLRIVCEAGKAPKYNKRGRATGVRQELVDNMKTLQEQDLMGGQRAYMQALFAQNGGACLSAMNAIKAVGNLWVPDREIGPRTLIFHVGLTGGGKTRSALQIAKDSGKPYLFLTASGGFSFDNLWNEKIIILDDFRGMHISFSAVLNITDVTNGVEVKARYSNKLMTADTFHFCCPVHPSELWGHLEENLEGKMAQLARRTTEIRVYGAPGPDTVVDESGNTVLKANRPQIFQTTPTNYKTAWSQSKLAWHEIQTADNRANPAVAVPGGFRGFLNP